MILAGDFAQLPPIAKSSQLYNLKYSSLPKAATNYEQECVIGKLLWQQVTIVVILKQNMRQTSQSNLDKKFRTCLENMRYGACTDDDIAFLRSRQANKYNPDAPSLKMPQFKNVSVITGRNSYKDKLNEIGCIRFAQETGQQLEKFYSLDRQDGYDDEGNKVKRKRRAPRARKFTEKGQDYIWNAPPSLTGQIAGCLSLCLRMPVMLQNNDATELCITKGQEGVVAGWDDYIGTNGKRMLKTLFVELINPPKPVQFSDLPLNVVPIPTSITTIQCERMNGSTFSIQRQQVIVAPNFAMTDYASQGKTRKFNVVHLVKCNNHQAYYTALSRSASAEGTLVIGSFHPQKIQVKELDGALRQEYRELEMLNTITELNYEGKLPESVCGLLRNPLIRSYQSWKKDFDDSKDWHHAIKWEKNETRIQEINMKSESWNEDKMRETFALADNPKKGKKRQNIDETNDHPRNAPKKTSIQFKGIIWDSVDWSCGYDSLYVIIYNLWIQNTKTCSQELSGYSQFMKKLVDHFSKVQKKQMRIEYARNLVRRMLHNFNPINFPLGEKPVENHRVLDKMFGNTEYGVVQYSCENCNHIYPVMHFQQITALYSVPSKKPGTMSISKLISKGTVSNKRQKACQECAAANTTPTYMDMNRIITSTPQLITFELTPENHNIKPDIKLDWESPDGTESLVLCGLIYGGGMHFTSRFIDNTGTVWYHDGIKTGSKCNEEAVVGLLDDTNWLRSTPENKVLIAAIYRNAKIRTDI